MNTEQHSAPHTAALASSSGLTAYGPTEPWLSAGLFLAGMGTVLLGPILPTLSKSWGLVDAAAGALLFIKFVGAFAGGISVPVKLRQGVLGGLLIAFAGFSAFAFSRGPFTAVPALFAAGFGLGLLIASTNILIGRRNRDNTGAVLARTNFFFSLGAVLIGIVIAELLPRMKLHIMLGAFAVCFLIVAAGGWLRATSGGFARTSVADQRSFPLPRRAFLGFAILLFLYGGLETCLAQWLTTYSARYTHGDIVGGQSAVVLLFLALTAGRAATSLALRKISEDRLLRGALIASAALIGLLVLCHSGGALSLCCILLGLALAPFFPTTFALLMHRRPSSQEAGLILAVSGLGAAALSWLMGIVSSAAGSLRFAMLVPFLAAAFLYGATFLTSRRLPIRASFPRGDGV